jgi:K+-sensing histidine kinase KdpD
MNTAVEIPSTVQPLHFLETLAHELRQPLSAIESTAYYLAMVLPRGEKRAQEHAARLQRLIEQANWILSCGLQLADTSPLAPEPVDLEELITQTVASQFADGASHCGEGDDSPQLDLAGDLPLVDLDPGRARCLIENLLAMMRRAADAAHPLRVRTSRATRSSREVALDFFVDVRSDESEECFGAGAALGIESARRIVEAHGGDFAIDFEAHGGVCVNIQFPESLCCPVPLESNVAEEPLAF